MTERPTPEEFNKPIEASVEVQTLNPAEAIQSAQHFFRAKGLAIDEEGLVSPQMTEEQLQGLAEWHRATQPGGIDMPDEDTFYKKVLLGVSLWRQKEADNINYLMGKGVGVEVSLRGTIEGRTKRAVNFPYRSHSDFELYAAYNPGDSNAGKENVYSPQFKRVFGSQEYFPSTDTKGLKKLPPELLYQTAETVNLGGIKVKVPQLELQFLDKWNSAESTPRAEGNDAELLARQYVLDRELIRKYLIELVINRQVRELEQKIQEDIDTQLKSISRLLKGTKASLQEKKQEITTQAMLEDLNDYLGTYLDFPDVSVGGIHTAFWVPIEPHQIDLEGNIVDEQLKQQITEKIKAKAEARIKALISREKVMDELFNRIDKDYSK
jgi:hypothetical protein